MSNDPEWSVYPDDDGSGDEYEVMGRIGNYTWGMARCDNQSEAKAIVEALQFQEEEQRRKKANVDPLVPVVYRSMMDNIGRTYDKMAEAVVQAVRANL